MVVKKSSGEKIFDVVNICVLTLISLACCYPLMHVLFASFSDPIELMSHRGIMLKPLGFTINGYKLVFKNPNISIGYMNTFIYVIAGTFVNIIFTSLGAYVLSRKNVLWSKLMMFLITFTMFFGGGLIPTYFLIKNLGMLNTRWVMIIPGAISTYNLIVMRTSFASIPYSLEEAAKIDGANDFTILFRIIMPLSKAVIAVMILFYSVAHWNSWFGAMVYLRDRKLYPLQLILREILITNDMQTMGDLNGLAGSVSAQEQADAVLFSRNLVQYCTIIVATVPILLLYPFIQKYFVQGVMIGSLKG